MPEGRDRLPRHDDGVEEGLAITPFRWRGTPMVGSPGLAARRGRGFGSPRIRRFSPIRGPENFSPAAGRGRGGRGGSALPSWYPRRPLNDITAVMRAIERRRDADVLETPSRIHQDLDHLEHNISPLPTLSTPLPTLSTKCCPPTTTIKFPKILLDITQNNDEDDSSLTPQKKLLNIIDSVEKVVMEEFRKMKRTPSAKKAEREKRVRTLMSMR